MKISKEIRAEFDLGDKEISSWVESMVRRELTDLPEGTSAKVSWTPKIDGLHCEVLFILPAKVEPFAIEVRPMSAKPVSSPPQAAASTPKGRSAPAPERPRRTKTKSLPSALSGGEILIRVLRGRKPVRLTRVPELARAIDPDSDSRTRQSIPKLLDLGFVKVEDGSISLVPDSFAPLSGRAPSKEVVAAIDLMKESPDKALLPRELEALGFTAQKIAAAIDAGWFRRALDQRIGYWRLEDGK